MPAARGKSVAAGAYTDTGSSRALWRHENKFVHMFLSFYGIMCAMQTTNEIESFSCFIDQTYSFPQHLPQLGTMGKRVAAKTKNGQTPSYKIK